MGKYRKVCLTKHTRTTSEGRIYSYWYLRWLGSDGRQRGRCIAKAQGPGRLSRWQANVLRARKESEINTHLGRCDTVRAPTLSKFTTDYLRGRRSEVSPATLALHRETSSYLLAYFGANRRIDDITKAGARDFKTALADGELRRASKRPVELKLITVEKHIRNAHTIFNAAVGREELLRNPFAKLSRTIRVDRDWYYVTEKDYHGLLEAAPNLNWRLLFALCRVAGLRLGEALHLEWQDIRWDQGFLRVTGKDGWQPKSRKGRKVPIFPELMSLLQQTWDDLPEGTKQQTIIGKISPTNLHRDFKPICRRAGVMLYKKPFHTLRKSAIEDWRRRYPGHLVMAWAGHSSLTVTDAHYTRLFESDFANASRTSIFAGIAQTPAQNNFKNPVDKGAENRIDLIEKNL